MKMSIVIQKRERKKLWTEAKQWLQQRLETYIELPELDEWIGNGIVMMKVTKNEYELRVIQSDR